MSRRATERADACPVEPLDERDEYLTIVAWCAEHVRDPVPCAARVARAAAAAIGARRGTVVADAVEPFDLGANWRARGHDRRSYWQPRHEIASETFMHGLDGHAVPSLLRLLVCVPRPGAIHKYYDNLLVLTYNAPDPSPIHWDGIWKLTLQWPKFKQATVASGTGMLVREALSAFEAAGGVVTGLAEVAPMSDTGAGVYYDNAPHHTSKRLWLETEHEVWLAAPPHIRHTKVRRVSPVNLLCAAQMERLGGDRFLAEYEEVSATQARKTHPWTERLPSGAAIMWACDEIGLTAPSSPIRAPAEPAAWLYRRFRKVDLLL